MKKVLAIMLAAVMVFSFAACGSGSGSNGDVFKVGMVCIGDANQAYDRNFYAAADAAAAYFKEKGVDVEWSYKYNLPVECADACAELADDGCRIVFCNSYGQEPQALITAADYPDTVFVSHTNYGSQADELVNTVNTMPDISQGRYLAGVAAGCKLAQLIDAGTIKPEEAIIGYVGAYTYSEVISGYTAFFLGARSVCPQATMKVSFIGSWGDMKAEAEATQTLVDAGAVIISQHSDNTSPATTAQQNGCFHIGYNINMSDVAPQASIISSRIDWTNYFIYAIQSVLDGKDVDPDYVGHGLKDGDVKMTELNEAIAAPGTAEAIAKAQAAIESGELHIFDVSKFTVDGKNVTSAMIDITADFVPDVEAVSGGYFHECELVSAPQFGLKIDGIELLNVAE